MKINAESFIENIDKFKLEEVAILISGNEPTLISKIEYLILKKLEFNGTNKAKIIDFKVKKNLDIESAVNFQSLFNKINIISIKNPNELIINNLKKIKINNSIIIINGENLKNNSKIKNFFDSHKKFYSIVCYKLSRTFKKKLIDKLINEKKCKLTNDAYWFLIENTSDEYQILENELEKIFSYGNDIITILEINKLSSSTNQIKLDDLFFQCIVGTNKSIIKLSGISIKSINEAYGFLQVVKGFSIILAKIIDKKNKESIDSLIACYLPKYLFKQKNSFKIAIKKTNSKKITAINKLIQKTETLLRKNDENFIIISQRFMLNFLRIFK